MLSDIKVYYTGTVIKRVWYWEEETHRSTDQISPNGNSFQTRVQSGMPPYTKAQPCKHSMHRMQKPGY